MDVKQVSTIITLATPVLAPLIVTLLKKFTGDKFSALNPIICTALGFVIDMANLLITGNHVSAGVALVLGAAGVGVREIVDQLKND